MLTAIYAPCMFFKIYYINACAVSHYVSHIYYINARAVSRIQARDQSSEIISQQWTYLVGPDFKLPLPGG